MKSSSKMMIEKAACMPGVTDEVTDTWRFPKMGFPKKPPDGGVTPKKQTILRFWAHLSSSFIKT